MRKEVSKGKGRLYKYSPVQFDFQLYKIFCIELFIALSKFVNRVGVHFCFWEWKIQHTCHCQRWQFTMLSILTYQTSGGQMCCNQIILCSAYSLHISISKIDNFTTCPTLQTSLSSCSRQRKPFPLIPLNLDAARLPVFAQEILPFASALPARWPIVMGCATRWRALV